MWLAVILQEHHHQVWWLCSDPPGFKSSCIVGEFTLKTNGLRERLQSGSAQTSLSDAAQLASFVPEQTVIAAFTPEQTNQPEGNMLLVLEQ